MKLENQVVSLELAKKLKELGVKQESQYYWCNFGKDDWRGPYVVDGLPEEDGERWLRYPDGGQHTFRKNFDCRDTASAFTVAELGEMLPEGAFSFISRRGWSENGDPQWKCTYTATARRTTHHEVAHTEADARAKILEYLIENKLMEI